MALVVLVVGGTVDPAAATEPPSWSDVQDARQDQAATAAMVTRLQGALDEAEARAASLSAAALAQAAAAAEARSLADAATSRAAALTAQSEKAQAELATRRGQLAGIASGLYRTRSDSTLLARLLTSAEPESLLRRLGLLDRLSTTWAGLVAQTQRTAATTAALQAQAEEARVARDEAARTAEETASAARTAADAEAGAVSAASDQLSTMYAQLATLKNTTAETERLYRLGQQTATSAAAGGAGGSGSSGTGGSGTSGPGGSGTSGGSGSSNSGGNGTGSGGTGTGSAPTGVTVDPAGAKAYARGALARYGWADDQYQCLVLLWNRESGWRADALNRSSGAYGIPQALPAEKMASAGADWRTNGNTQVDWGLSYIRSRYGSPCGAWSHSVNTGWY